MTVTADQIPSSVRAAITRIVAYNWADEERDYAGCGDVPGQNARQSHIYEDLVLASRWLNGYDDGQGPPHATCAHPAAVMKQSHGESDDLIRVRVRWSEVVTCDGARDLDATRIRRLGTTRKTRDQSRDTSRTPTASTATTGTRGTRSSAATPGASTPTTRRSAQSPSSRD
jgi:hypothetical protein